jgi:uncharacterized protein (TIGR03067 family)
MRIAAGLLAVILACVVVLLLLRRPGAAPAPPPQSDRQLLQGTWRMRQVEAGGVLLDPGFRWIFAGDQCTLTDNLGQPLIATQFQLDATRTPKEITLRPQQGGIWPGIYLLDGDSLTLCLNQGGPQRPTTFTTQAGDSLFLYVLEREPAAPQPAGAGLGRGRWP